MIYCVEDDDNIRELVVYTLQNTGFDATGFVNGKDFFKALDDDTPELVLLDIMLQDEDGIKILKKLKANNSTKDIPVIMVTAKSSEYDKVKGLDSGAEDYITKPFGMMEMVSRVKAVLRRTRPKVSSAELSMGDITVNVDKHLVMNRDEEILLTFKEFELLRYMIENKGIALTRNSILEKIWGYDSECETRTVDVHIRTLRQKLGESGDLIKTIRGVGYRMG